MNESDSSEPKKEKKEHSEHSASSAPESSMKKEPIMESEPLKEESTVLEGKVEESKSKSKPPSDRMMPIGDLFSKSWNTFTDHLGQLFLVYIIVPLIIFALVLLAIPILGALGVGLGAATSFLGGAGLASAGVGIGLIIFLGLIFIVAMIILGSWHQAALTSVGVYSVEGKKESLKFFLKEGWGYVWKMLGLTILTGLIVAGGFLLLIIPGIIFGVYLTFATVVLVKEKIGVTDAISRSWELVRGHFWAVFGRQLLLSLIMGIIVYIPIVGFIVAFFGSLYMVVYTIEMYKDLTRIKA